MQVKKVIAFLGLIELKVCILYAQVELRHAWWSTDAVTDLYTIHAFLSCHQAQSVGQS